MKVFRNPLSSWLGHFSVEVSPALESLGKMYNSQIIQNFGPKFSDRYVLTSTQIYHIALNNNCLFGLGMVEHLKKVVTENPDRNTVADGDRLIIPLKDGRGFTFEFDGTWSVQELGLEDTISPSWSLLAAPFGEIR